MKATPWLLRVALTALLLLIGIRSGDARPDRATIQPSFRFQSNFWMNLHHVLYREGTLHRSKNTPSASRQLTALSQAGLSEAERRAWDKAVDYYAQKFAGRRLLFDEQLIHVNNGLSEELDANRLQSSALPPELASTLEQAAPLYRKYWWAAHNKANQAWIS